MVFSSKVKVVISVVAIALSSLLLSLDMFGVIPFLILVVSFFYPNYSRWAVPSWVQKW